MDIAARRAVGRMAEHGSDCWLRISKVRRHRGKCVAKPVRGQIRKVGSSQDAEPCLRQSGKGPVGRTARKNKRALFRQISKQLRSSTAERANTFSQIGRASCRERV